MVNTNSLRSDDSLLIRLSKELSKDKGGPSDEAIDFFIKNSGKACTIRHTTHVGTIYALNHSTDGFYPGSRYPIKVKMENGNIFEYDVESVILT